MVKARNQVWNQVRNQVWEQEDNQKQKQVADTILSQLGGVEFLAMTGAKHILYGMDAGLIFLSLRLPKRYNKINYVKISLTLLDDYIVEFGCVKKYNYEILDKKVLTVSNIYCDTLQSIFTEKTGLDTYL